MSKDVCEITWTAIQILLIIHEYFDYYLVSSNCGLQFVTAHNNTLNNYQFLPPIFNSKHIRQQ